MINDTPESPLKPQVIDLEAEDVIVEGENAPSAPPPPVTPRKSIPSSALLAIAVLGAAVVGAWIYKDILSSYLPSNELIAAQARIDALEAQSKTLGEQLAAISGASDQLKNEIQSVSEKTSAAQNTGAALEARIASTEAATKSVKAELEKLKTVAVPNATVAAPNATTGAAVDSGALAALAQRLDAVEKDVASLKTVSAPADHTTATATLSQSLSDLKAKIASGASYRDELERISRMVPAAAGLDTLTSNANEGLPTAAGLAAELTALIPLLPKPEIELPSSDNSYLDSFWNAMKSVITIRRIGDTDWPDLAAKCAALAEGGDLAQAVEKIDKAEGSKPVALSNWRDRAAARIVLETALEETSQAVLRQITSMDANP